MIRHLAHCGLFTILVGSAFNSAEARLWTNRDGRTVEAELVSVDDAHVRIRRTSDGRLFDIRLEILSDADQHYLLDTKSAQLPQDNSPWVAARMNDHDARPLLEKRRARMENGSGCTDAMLDWSKGLNASTNLQPSYAELLQVVVNYPAIWTGDRHNKQASQLRIERLKLLTPQAIDAWRKELEPLQGHRVSVVQAATVIVNLSELFGDTGFDGQGSQQLLARLALLPPKHCDQLAEIMNESRLQAAVELIRNDDFFRQGEFQAALADKSLATLRSYVESERQGGANDLSPVVTRAR